MEVVQLSSDIEVGHIGPPLHFGALPSVFYFALSAFESLSVDPYNQPAVSLAAQGIRVFSFNLPAHGKDLKAVEAIGVWASAFAEGKDPLAPFLEKALFSLNALIAKGWVVKEKVGLMGLSRGGLVAALLATKCTPCATVCFAPMIELGYAREFEQIKEDPQVEKYNLNHYADPLCMQKIRIYIGNRDTRVGTARSFFFLEKLVDTAFVKGKRSPSLELIIAPSIGHMGHGTSKETFEAGAQFLRNALC